MTHRVLKEMALAKQRDEWERTSWLLAKIHNVNYRPCDRITPAEVNPMHSGPLPARAGGPQKVDADYNAAMYEALKTAEDKRRGGK
jgi:hypothetical protein